MGSRAARSVTRTATLVAGLAVGAVLSLPTAAGAHYPYELVPGWFAETLGPAASANPDCQLVETVYDDLGATRWALSNPGQDGDWPACRQIWGSAGEQTRCGIQVESVHYSEGGESLYGYGNCFVAVFAEQDDGTIALESRCGIIIDVSGAGLDSWTPNDCRADSLPGWPSSPYGEPLPADPSKTATCKVRKCTYELTCTNGLGAGSCDAFTLEIEAGASFGVIASATPVIGANQRQAVEVKTTVFGRQLIKRARKNGKRKINGNAELYDDRVIAEEPHASLDEQRVTIKLKR